MNQVEQRKAAKEFAEYWKGKGDEKSQSQVFWMMLLRKVFGIENPEAFIAFESRVKLNHTSFIDGYIDETHVMIEQKSLGKDLSEAIKQSDGTSLTPHQQAKRYAMELPYSKRPRWIVTCNFQEFRVYDMENPQADPTIVYLKDLEREYYRLEFLVTSTSTSLKKELEVSLKAGEIVGVIYDSLLKQYNEVTPHVLHSLNILCVRLVFCFYAEDAGLFGPKNAFRAFLEDYTSSQARMALIQLFKVLNTPYEERDPYLEPNLASFPYVNGGLFAETDIVIPLFTDDIMDILLNKASSDFDWSHISPTIFGAVFESTLNTETRRKGGMHYTSLENIHKVIDPLFLDELGQELQILKEIKVVNRRDSQANRYAKFEAFQNKLASLTFFDPACGSGNFLTETYIALRRLENEAIKAKYQDQSMLGLEDGDSFKPIKVSLSQFYGIEINEFASTVAQTALWIAENQMIKETESIIHREIDFLPLKSYAHIHTGNALRVDWETIVPKDQLNYIIGNPPFVGARLMSAEQKSDLHKIFEGWRNLGNLDYVTCWFKKAADYMKSTDIQTALVATNSISQGDIVGILWKQLFKLNIKIDFAHRSFVWSSESSEQAAVYCVIVGFSYQHLWTRKRIFSNNQVQYVANINGYLFAGESICVESRNTPLCDVPKMGIGNKPIDDGNYLFSEEEKEEFIKKEPLSAPFFKKWFGSKEFINNKPRYCLWVGECDPNILSSMRYVKERIGKVKEFRLSSKSEGTRRLANTPTRFHVENMPTSDYIIIPSTSSERRKYIPMGFMSKEEFSSNAVLLIPDATLYHFGVLTSNVHMAWMRTVAGRLKSDYRYSKDIVYNNFPWPDADEVTKETIAATAQAILDARAKYPNASLADLYNELTMPPDLRMAHQANDRAVMKAYGFDVKTMTEADCVAELMRLYQSLTGL